MRTLLCVIGLSLVVGISVPSSSMAAGPDCEPPAMSVQPVPGESAPVVAATPAPEAAPFVDAASALEGVTWLSDQTGGDCYPYTCYRDLKTSSSCYLGGGQWGTFWVRQQCRCRQCPYLEVYDCFTLYYYCVG